MIPCLWGVEWRSENRLDGKTRHLVYTRTDPLVPVLFRRRADARAYIEQEFGWLRDRPDLKAEPFGWQMPVAVRVKVVKEGT